MTSARSNHFVLNGFDDLTYRLAEQLSGRYGADVVVIMTRLEALSAREFDDLPRVRVTVVDRVDENALEAAGAADAAGFALTIQDDVGNIHLALQVREVAPAARLVIRMYNTDLGHGIEALLGNCKVLSDAEIAAPELVSTALGEVAASPVQVGRRTLVVAQRADVQPQDIVCGLAVSNESGEPAMLPADDGQADLVLAEQQAQTPWETTLGITRPAGKKPSWLRLLLTFLSAMVSRKTRIAITIVLAIIIGGGAVLGYSLHLPFWDSFYLATVTVLSGPQPTEELGRSQQSLQLLVGLAGLAFIPLVTALIVEGTVRARLAVAQVRLIQPRSGHVVVVGLGGVGTRILRLLHDREIKLVAVTGDENARGVTLARELSIPLVIGDPSRETTLRQAGVDRCKALMAVDRSDVVNLQTALHGRNLQSRLRVVLRLFDGDLADRARRVLDLRDSRSVSNVAVPAFAEALLEREVIGTIAVDRRVLLIADVFITAGSPLEDTPLAGVDDPGRVRIIAVTEFGEPRPLWKPSPARRIRRRDKLTVVATRDGLSDLVRRQNP